MIVFPADKEGKTPLSLQSFQQCELGFIDNWLAMEALHSERDGWLGRKEVVVMRRSTLCLRRCHSGSSWCLGGIRYRGEARLTETDEGRQTPTQSFLPSHPYSPSEGKQSNVPEIAAMPTLMPSPGPSNI